VQKLKDMIEEYYFDLDDDNEEAELKKLIKDNSKRVTRYIIKLYKNRTSSPEEEKPEKEPEKEKPEKEPEEKPEKEPEPPKKEPEEEKTEFSEEFQEALDDVERIIVDLDKGIGYFYEGDKIYNIITFSAEEEIGLQLAEDYDEDSLIKLTAKGWLRATENGDITSNKEEGYEEEYEEEVAEAEEAVNKAEEQANTSEEEETAKKAAEALKKAMEAAKKAEEAARKKQEEEAKKQAEIAASEAKEAKEEAAEIIQLPRPASDTEPEVEEYIKAARRIADRFREIKDEEDDRIANDIEGFLDVYDSETDKDAAFDLIEPLEEGKAGSILKSIKSTIRARNLPIPDNIYDNVKKRYGKLKAKLKELSKDAKNNKEAFLNHARTFLKYYKIVDDFEKFVSNTLKTKPKKPTQDKTLKAAENIERILRPLIKDVVRKEWQKRIM
jgi:hypothetical protein